MIDRVIPLGFKMNHKEASWLKVRRSLELTSSTSVNPGASCPVRAGSRAPFRGTLHRAGTASPTHLLPDS